MAGIAAVAATIGLLGGIAIMATRSPARHEISAVKAVATTTTTTTAILDLGYPDEGTPPDREPLVIHLTHDLDLAAALDAAGMKLMGRGTSSAEERPFIVEYHAMETRNQQAAYEGGTSYVTTPQAQAEAFIRRNFPNEVEAYAMMQAGQVVLDMIERGGSNPHPSTSTSSTSTTRYCPYRYGTTTTTSRYGYSSSC